MAKLKEWKERIEVKLREVLKPFEPDIFYRALSYYPLQEGKRLRPLFVCAVCDAYGGEIEDAITVGCAIELIHNYSLVHDDLPALDNDTLRRGTPTCHVAFGEDLALLAGDALLTLAFEVLSTEENFLSLSSEELIRIIRVVAQKAGYKGMVGGQVLDIRGLADQETISLKKTAELFSACFVCGGIVAKRFELARALEKLGLEVGLMFQMIDDYADKDGFYRLYGEGLKEKIGAMFEEVRTLAKTLGLNTHEMQELFELMATPVL